MIDKMVHRQYGLTGDQIIELTEKAHMKEIERMEAMKSQGSGSEESDAADILASALAASPTKSL